MPKTPTAAQLAQLANLQATATSAVATYNSAVTTLATAKAAVQVANQNLKNYEAYIYGGNTKPGIYDEGPGAT